MELQPCFCWRLETAWDGKSKRIDCLSLGMRVGPGRLFRCDKRGREGERETGRNELLLRAVKSRMPQMPRLSQLCRYYLKLLHIVLLCT